jgi:hypothetical protein
VLLLGSANGILDLGLLRRLQDLLLEIEMEHEEGRGRGVRGRRKRRDGGRSSRPIQQHFSSN